jgi:hypothetical protein
LPVGAGPGLFHNVWAEEADETEQDPDIRFQPVPTSSRLAIT